MEYSIYPVCVNKKIIIDRKKISLVLVSNIKRIKNIEFAIELASYYSCNKKVDLDIFYNSFDKEYLDELRNSCIINSNYLRVNFINGEDEPQDYFYKYDLALHTSKNESGPLVILEYLAHGLPFLSFNTGQSIQLIKSNYSEFIINSFHLQDWVNSLDKILYNGRQFYKLKLKNFFQKKYSLNNYYLQCKKIYQENQI